MVHGLDRLPLGCGTMMYGAWQQGTSKVMLPCGTMVTPPCMPSTLAEWVLELGSTSDDLTMHRLASEIFRITKRSHIGQSVNRPSVNITEPNHYYNRSYVLGSVSGGPPGHSGVHALVRVCGISASLDAMRCAAGALGATWVLMSPKQQPNLCEKKRERQP